MNKIKTIPLQKNHQKMVLAELFFNFFKSFVKDKF